MTDTIVATLADMFSGAFTAAANDRILLQNGTYTNSGRVNLRATAVPVTVMAQNQGGATINGAPIDLGSSGLVFQGFNLQFEAATGDFISLNNVSGRFSRNDCSFNNSGTGDQRWFTVKKDDVMFDHNIIHGKRTVDDVLLVGGSTFVRGCKVLYNHFYDFVETGSTKSETIRIGESSMAFMDFNCEVAFNRIDTTNADTEVISVKANNVYLHNNTLDNVAGSLVLRQAYNCTVDANVFMNGAGIRLGGGSNHIITRNQVIRDTVGGVSRPFYVTTGNVTDLLISGGTPGSGVSGVTIPLNADTAQVRNCTINNNIFVNDSGLAISGLIFWGDASGLQPTGNQFMYNILMANTGTLTVAQSGAVGWGANTVSGNIIFVSGTATIGDMPTSGYINTNPNVLRLADNTCRCAYVLVSGQVGPSGR